MDQFSHCMTQTLLHLFTGKKKTKNKSEKRLLKEMRMITGSRSVIRSWMILNIPRCPHVFCLKRKRRAERVSDCADGERRVQTVPSSCTCSEEQGIGDNLIVQDLKRQGKKSTKCWPSSGPSLSQSKFRSPRSP